MTNLARDLWRVVEPFHQVAYRSPEATNAYESLGLVPGPQQYFANRLAVLGPIGPTTASAVLYGFNPSYVASVVPTIWNIARPSDICTARQQAARACLSRIVSDLPGSPVINELATLVRRMVTALDFAGSPLGGACFDQPYPEDPIAALWHSCTVLREHRGDAHWRATAAHGIDPVECHLLHAADGAMPGDLLQRVSGWADQDWLSAKARLLARGLLADSGASDRLTHDGMILKRAIEAATDAHADALVEAVGPDQVTRVCEEMRPWIVAIMATDVIGAWKIREALWRDE